MSSQKSPDDIFDELIANEAETIRVIIRHVAAGGTLPGLCDVWGVRYGDVIAWLQDDKERHGKYSDALNARSEWSKEQMFEELRRMALSRVVDFFDNRGMVKDAKDWTPEMKALVKKIKYDENGEIEELQFWNKEKALELLGKNMDMFTETHSISGKFSLEDLIQASREDDDKK